MRRTLPFVGICMLISIVDPLQSRAELYPERVDQKELSSGSVNSDRYIY